MDAEYTNNDAFNSPVCPSTSSFRHWKKKQITNSDKVRAQQTVVAQTEWAKQVNRKDKLDAEWSDAAAQTANPDLDEFEVILEKMERSKTADGRCEKALRRLLQHRGTWADSTSYRGASWLWYVQRLLPRYYAAAKVWSTIEVHRIKAKLWSANGTRLLKGKSTSKNNLYGLPAYCDQAFDAAGSILFRLLDFYDPRDGAHCKPTMVMVASIVLGHATSPNGVPHCYTACLLQRIRDSDAPPEPKSVFSHAMDLFGCEGPRTCHPFAKEFDIVQAVFDKRAKKPFCSGNTHTHMHTLTLYACVCVYRINTHPLTQLHTHSGGPLFPVHCFTLSDPSDNEISHKATLWDHHNQALPDNLQQGQQRNTVHLTYTHPHLTCLVPPPRRHDTSGGCVHNSEACITADAN